MTDKRFLQIGVGLGLAALALVPSLASGDSSTPKPSPRPKISVSPQTLHATKNKQDTMIKRGQRHLESANGNTASGENPDASNAAPKPTMSPH